MTVEILCSTFNGAEFLFDLVESIQKQTHRDWRLWVRDDGSRDETPTRLDEVARYDDRIHVHSTDGRRLGATASFGWLLENAPAGSEYFAFADQDDVWLPQKLERMLAAMRVGDSGTPTLVHSDLRVVDSGLREIDGSFWSYAGIAPEPATLRRFVVRNPVTGAACMINRPLRELAGRLPAEAVFHDWWLALVAVAFGRIVALPEPTVLYRQHERNVVGAKDPRVAISQVAGTVLTGLGNTGRFRDGVVLTANQARAFKDRFGDRLSADDRHFLEEYARIPSQTFFKRKRELMRLRALPEHGMLQTLGILLRG